MKSILKSVLILTINYSLSYSQYAWEIQNPIPTSSELKSVQFVSAETGWAIGAYGNIIHTNDGGKTWTFQDANIDEISDLYFIDNSIGWAIGMKFTGEFGWCGPILKSCLLKTMDGGHNWIIQSGFDHKSSSGPYPFSIYFINKDIGWIASSVQNSENYNSIISKTCNGGETWVVQDSIELSIHDIYFINDNIGWAVGAWSSAFDVCIMKTNNGGDTWIPQSGKVKGVLESVFFIDESIGWTVGTENIILKTADGGDTWTDLRTNLNFTSPNQFLSVHFTNPDTGFVTGWYPFLKTTNGGQTWSISGFNQDAYLSVFFLNHKLGWRVGTRGVIQKTTDAGNNWTFQNENISKSELSSIDFVDNKYGWVANEDKIFTSSDGGKRWEILNKPSNNGFFSFDFVDSLTAYFSCGSGIYKTTDSGNNWEKVYSLNLGSYMESITYFSNSENGWVIYDQGKIIHTADGGLSWTSQDSHTSKTFYDMCFINETNGWIVGKHGLILRTKDSGKNWENIEIPDDWSDIVKVNFIDSLNGWILMYGGSNDDNCLPSGAFMQYTNDGGITWSRYFIHEDYNCAIDMQFTDENNGWILANFWPKTLFRTKNKGLTWEKISIPAQYRMAYKMDFNNANEGWLIGPNGTIIHLTIDETSDIKENLLQHREMKYMISQNYPNPFNPSTTIEFTLPKSEFTTLKVYNILGKEVANLVKAQLNQGNHRYQFDGSNLASGVYYYHLVAGDYRVVKKMILIR